MFILEDRIHEPDAVLRIRPIIHDRGRIISSNFY